MNNSGESSHSSGGRGSNNRSSRGDSDQLVGSILGGAYELMNRIGMGAMGAVYRAEQRSLGRTVAVKILHRELLHEEASATRFFNEARAASKLSHPNVVNVIDFGKTDAGLPYLVMEYLRGPDLRAVMRSSSWSDLGRIEDIVCQILQALGEAHAAGIVHRDLKPANVILEPTRSGSDLVKVVDFGLATMRNGDPRTTSNGMVRGTPTYMAPEQASGQPVDARADLYALGVILFEMLAGRPPFQAETPEEVLAQHLSIRPPDPRSFAPARGMPESIVQVVLRALEKNPARRFQSADELAVRLRASCASKHGTASASAPWSKPPSSRAPISRPKASGRVRADSNRFDGMDRHLSWLDQIRLQCQRGSRGACLVGPYGSGRTTILRSFAQSAKAQGDATILVDPDPWWAEPAHHVLREAIQKLAELPTGGKEPRSWKHASPEAVAGLHDAFLGVSESLTPLEHRLASSAALRWALDRACKRAASGRAIVVLDDLDRMDGVSRRAFADALNDKTGPRWLLVASHGPHYHAAWATEENTRKVDGIRQDHARAMLREAGIHDQPLPEGDSISPLLVEQIIFANQEGQRDVRPVLESLVSNRIIALQPNSRLILFALAVLGNDVEYDVVEHVVGDMCDLQEGLLSLALGGFISRGPRGYCWQSPLFRDVVVGEMPDTLQATLAARAASILQAGSVPVEARANLALHAGNALEALFLLECVARANRVRGDERAALRALRRAYDFARAERRRSETDELDHAIVVFGRKLAEALLRDGQLDEARLTMSEVLDVADVQGAVDVLSSLVAVARGRNRTSDARALLSEAISRARQAGNRDMADSLKQLNRRFAS